MNTINIERYITQGEKDKHWYRDCMIMFIDIFGSEQLKLVTSLFAATSINTSLKSNITLFRRALYEIQNDLPIGHYLPNIQSQLARIRSGQELSGRKINAFAHAMRGDPEAVVVDIWLLRAFDMDRKYIRAGGKSRSGGASEKQFDLIELYVREKAELLSLTPAQASAMIWSGVRTEQSRETETRYGNILRYHFNNLFNVI